MSRSCCQYESPFVSGAHRTSKDISTAVLYESDHLEVVEDKDVGEMSEEADRNGIEMEKSENCSRSDEDRNLKSEDDSVSGITIKSKDVSQSITEDNTAMDKEIVSEDIGKHENLLPDGDSHLIETTVKNKNAMSDDDGKTRESTGIFEKPNDKDSHREVVEDKVNGYGMQSEEVGKNGDLLPDGDSHLEVKEATVRNKEEVTDDVDQNGDLLPDRDSHLKEDTVRNKEEKDNDGKNWESIFEKPMCLISAKDDRFEVVEDTLKCLEKIESPLNIVAIAGLCRTGKSYLMNRLAGKSSSGFILGSTIKAETKGIWAWCRRHPTKVSQVLLLLDTEGLGDVNKGSMDYDNKIFTITTLLSSTLVYNIMSAFNQDAVEKLTYITMLSKNLKVKSDSSSDDQFECIMPHFVLCLRDFTLELEFDGKVITEDEYLEYSLQTKQVKTQEDEKYNRPRECIKKYFTHRKVFTFDRPASRNVVRNLETARDEDLSKDFILETEKFLSYVYDCPGKVLLDETPVTGSILAKLLPFYVKAMNDGNVPCVEDAMMTLTRLENERHAKNAVEKYKGLLKQIHLPVFDQKELLKLSFENQGNTLSELQSKLMFDTGNKIVKASKAEMQILYEKVDKENRDLLYDHCLATINEMYEKNIRNNIEKGKYAVAGGHGIYTKDMDDLYDEYNKKLELIDFAVRKRALSDYQNEVMSESKKIMNVDKEQSEKKMKDSVTKQLETLTTNLMEMETARKQEREREKRRKAQYKQEMWELREARRKDKERMDMLEEERRQQEATRNALAYQWERRQGQLEEQRRRAEEKWCILS